MSITLTGTGSLFARAGKYVKAIRNLQGMMAETLPIGSVDDAGAIWGASGPTVNDFKTMYNAIEAQYQSARQSDIGTLYTLRDTLRTVIVGQIPSLVSILSNTIIGMADDDAKLVSRDIITAVKELDRQMRASSDSIDANATSVSVAAASGNTGNATVIATVKNGKGVNREYVYAEVMELTATGDAGSGSTAGSEPMSLLGEVAESNKLAWNWPDGSGASTTTTVVDPSIDAAANLLTNSDFEDWGGVPESSANMPNRWTKIVGVIGTDIKKNTTAANLYSSRTGSTAALEIAGDGSTLVSIVQKFNNSTNGTSKTLLPNTVYAVNYNILRSAAIAAGVLVLSLVDSTNTVINDDAGTANTISKTLSALGASYEQVSGFIITPKVLPSDYRLCLRLTTAMTAAKSVYIDDMSMCVAKEAYARGPFVAAFRGSTDVAKNDKWNITVANDLGGLFQTYLFWAMLNVPAMEASNLDIQIASNAAGSETINDSLCA